MSRTVHPHVCGEHVALPAAWDGNERFIPTCVGNMPVFCLLAGSAVGSSPRVWGTCASPLPSTCRWSVHPHVCGEHAVQGEHSRLEGRFIPTCVGNISPASPAGPTPTVHPHVCGEHNIPTAPATAPHGSSPRVWGTFEGGQGEDIGHRFIPTCVGNMAVQSSGTGTTAVHPHVCGEHSPQTVAAHHPGRFIPTCVGNMSACWQN